MGALRNFENWWPRVGGVADRHASRSRLQCAGIASSNERGCYSPHASRSSANVQLGLCLEASASSVDLALPAQAAPTSRRNCTVANGSRVSGGEGLSGLGTGSFARFVREFPRQSAASARAAQQGVAADPRPVAARLSPATAPFVASDPWHAPGIPTRPPAGPAPGLLRWPRAAERQSVRPH